MGLLYLVTFGVYGIGWALDGFFMPTLTDHANSGGKFSTDLEILRTYLIAASPFGVIGGHQYYSGRKLWGLAYTFTLGGCGTWWLFDLFRISAIVHRRKQWIKGVNRYKRYADDVYLIWFLFGLLGGHHFYLKRYKSGLVYFFTLGCFGIGWFVDLVRLPWLVRDFNLDHYPEEDVYFTDAILEDLSDFDRKELQKIIRQARYNGENISFEDDDETDGKYFDLDRVVSAIRASHHYKEEANEVQLFENVKLKSTNERVLAKERASSQITTVAVISHANDSCAIDKNSSEDIVPSRMANKSRGVKTDLVPSQNGKAVILNTEDLQSQTTQLKMNRSKSIPANMTTVQCGDGTKSTEKQKSRKLSLSYSRQYDEKFEINHTTPNMIKTRETNIKHAEDDNSDEIAEYITGERRDFNRVQSEAGIVDNRKRKMLIRSNTQVAGLSWTDPMSEESCSNGRTKGHGARRVSLESSNISRVTQIPIRSAKRTVSTSSAHSQTSDEEGGIQMALDKRKVISARSKRSNSVTENLGNKRSLSEIEACETTKSTDGKQQSQSISDEIINIVSSASLMNVFEDIEEIPTDDDLTDTTSRNDTLRSVKDTGIGVHNVKSVENKPTKKRSMSFPSRQTSIENDKMISNGSVIVLKDDKAPFMEPSKSAILSLRRSSTQSGIAKENKPEKTVAKRKRSLLPKLAKSSSGTVLNIKTTEILSFS